MYFSTESQDNQKISPEQRQKPSQDATSSDDSSESKQKAPQMFRQRPRQKPSQKATPSVNSSKPTKRGPVTRSRTAARAAFSYSDVLQGKSMIEVQTSKEFADSQKKSQSIKTEDNIIFKNKQKLAELTHAEHVKMNQQQWATLKASVKNETTKWKNSLIQNEC